MIFLKDVKMKGRKMLDETLFTRSMAMLFEMYDRKPSGAIMEGYWLVLQDMSDQEFTSSIKSILSSRTYASLPKPAEILEYSRPDTESIATIAWSDVERAISKAGAYQSVTFEDKVVNSVIDALGGWVWLCSQDIAEIKWIKKDFNKLYGIHLKREEHPTHLIGISERSNGVVEVIPTVKAGYEIPKCTILPALNPSKEQYNTTALISGAIKDMR